MRHRAASATPSRPPAAGHHQSGPTDDRTHGTQQLSFFNGHYGSWCNPPQLAFLSFDREAEQCLCAAVLRPGNAVPADGTVGLLCRLLPMLRSAFPPARFLVRLDGGLRPPRSSISWMRNPCSTTWWRWRRTRCCSGTPSPRWRSRRRRAPRATAPRSAAEIAPGGEPAPSTPSPPSFAPPVAQPQPARRPHLSPVRHHPNRCARPPWSTRGRSHPVISYFTINTPTCRSRHAPCLGRRRTS